VSRQQRFERSRKRLAPFSAAIVSPRIGD